MKFSKFTFNPFKKTETIQLIFCFCDSKPSSGWSDESLTPV